MYVHDLRGPNDAQGRTYKEVNTEKQHNIPIGALVQLETGARAFIVCHGRDCDMAPLYYLSLYQDDTVREVKGFRNSSWSGGYPENALILVSGDDMGGNKMSRNFGRSPLAALAAIWRATARRLWRVREELRDEAWDEVREEFVVLQLTNRYHVWLPLPANEEMLAWLLEHGAMELGRTSDPETLERLMGGKEGGKR